MPKFIKICKYKIIISIEGAPIAQTLAARVDV